MEALVPIVMVGIFLLAFWFRYGLHKSHMRQIEELARRLGGVSLGGRGWLFGLDGAGIRAGSYEDHRVDVSYLVRGSGKSKRTYAQVEVEVADPGPGFRVRPAGALNRLGRWLGLVSDTKTGNERIDDKFILDGRPDALQGLFAHGSSERALDRLFGGEGVSGVRLSGRKLSCEVRVHGAACDKVQVIIRELVALAKLCDRKPIEVKVLGSKVRFAWTGGTEQALCPYCRDEIAPEGALALAACERCDTVHHTECMDEAGGCTVFGCGGRRAGGERA